MTRPARAPPARSPGQPSSLPSTIGEPVVEKRTVPKERVRLDTDTVTEERQVPEEVSKERIVVDDEGRRR